MPRPPYRIPTVTAVVVALSATFGTGLYAALGPAAASAGTWFPLGVLLAALLALGVVGSTAHLSLARPAGPELARGDLPAPALRLGAVARVTSRAAAGSAAALVFGAYVLPTQPVTIAVVAVLAVVAVNAFGVRISPGAARGLVVGTLLALTVAIVVGLRADGPHAVLSSAMPAAATGAGIAGDGAGRPTTRPSPRCRPRSSRARSACSPPPGSCSSPSPGCPASPSSGAACGTRCGRSAGPPHSPS
ncbi:hypothetical protein [Pseudonocardia alni]|uniref:hypothetical protein n=1 Tax=Pseudonocardia alni TaxID=33907 RepID=UPI0027A0D434|nr:hypothetical protein PaSha_20810 [Pseudonocardia alni]